MIGNYHFCHVFTDLAVWFAFRVCHVIMNLSGFNLENR